MPALCTVWIFFVPSTVSSERKAFFFFLQDITWLEGLLVEPFVLPEARALEVWRGRAAELVRSRAGIPLLLLGHPPPPSCEREFGI